ncbi:MAG: flagellar biosynthesis protein [Methylibium sp.]|nr:flagellar biosynthesis protein [Methylibium sp.]
MSSRTHRAPPPATDSWFNQLDELPPRPRMPLADYLHAADAGLDPQSAADAALHSAAGRPIDQAQGLRRLFTGHTLRFVAVVSNPNLAFGGALLERLCTAYAELGLSTLVVDAGERSRAPSELASFDLAEGVDVLSPQVRFLAARGLALRFVDASGSTSGFLDAVAEAAPDVDVVLLHASAADLARLLTRRVHEMQAHALRPIVLCDEQNESITHAYSAIKLLALRSGLMAHDLLISAEPGSPRAALVAESVARCADDFLGAALHDWVAIDPVESATDAPSPALQHLVREQLACALRQRIGDSGFGALGISVSVASHGSALPALTQRHGPRAQRRP